MNSFYVKVPLWQITVNGQESGIDRAHHILSDSQVLQHTWVDWRSTDWHSHHVTPHVTKTTPISCEVKMLSWWSYLHCAIKNCHYLMI